MAETSDATSPNDLDKYQEAAVQTDRNRENDLKGRIARILGLASESGAVLEAYKRLLRDNIDERNIREVLRVELGDVLWFCATIAAANDLRLSEIAAANLKRAGDRYGELDLKRAPDFETGFSPPQRFPRRLVVQFGETQTASGPKRTEPILIDAIPNAFPKGSLEGSKPGKRIGYDLNKPLGDPLTDNQRQEDGYRFHDAIHMAFMAVLDWSPVMRAMLQIKRKEDAATDEGEDSARQMLAEEGLAAVLQQMSKRRLGFAHPRAVNDEVMEVVRAITNDVEVKACQDSLWARAISQGFNAMAALRKNGGGFLTADLDARTLSYSETKP